MQKEEIFGKILQEERKAKKISQEKLAKISGLDRTYISLIENGKRSPSLSTILKISSALKILPSELFLKFEEYENNFYSSEGEKNAK